MFLHQLQWQRSNQPVLSAMTTAQTWCRVQLYDPALLAACYQNNLALAHERGIKSIAFPSVSTGVYGYPIEQACRVALRETFTHLQAHDLPQRVTFVCFSASDLECYQAAISESA